MNVYIMYSIKSTRNSIKTEVLDYIDSINKSLNE